MRWDDAMNAVLERLRSDTTLMAALGGDRITRADSSTTPQVPGIIYQVTSSRRRENDETVFTRWDVRAATLGDAVTIEERLQANLDRADPETLGGLPMWLQHVDGWDAPEAGAGVVQRTVLYRFTVLKER